MEWDSEFLKFIEDLETKKPVILCGDMNVAHNEIGKAIDMLNKYFTFNNYFIRYC